MRILGQLLFLMTLALASSAASAQDQPTVRVSLTCCSAKSVQLSASRGMLAARAPDGTLLLESAAIVVTAGSTGVSLQPASGGNPVAVRAIVLSPVQSDAAVTLAADGTKPRSYSGSFDTTAVNGKLSVVNTVALEDYVAGVVAVEIGERSPIETLKAQAVAVRTYALRYHTRHASTGCDLCDSTHCQSFLGLSDSTPVRQAVKATAGTVLTFNGKLAEVMYSADGGGATQDYSEINPGLDAPYLCGSIDPPDIPHPAWQKTYTLAELARRFSGVGIAKAAGMQSISVSKTGVGGRVLSVQLTSPAGTAEVSGRWLRTVLGDRSIRSTLFGITVSEDGTVTFTGRGYGHGVGLCQTGARWLAMEPHNYTCEQILQHYFPGTRLLPSNKTGTAAPVITAKAASTVQVLESRKIEVTPPPASVKATAKPKPAGQLPIEVRLQDPGRL